MADLRLLVPHLLHSEGGFVNDPDDPGGMTNKGITMSTYAYYCRKKGYPQPTAIRLKEMSPSTWMDIVKTLYWDKCRADEISSQSVANMIVDWYFNSGAHAIKHTQTILGVKADGVVGPKTLAAINSQSPLPLFGQIKNERKKYYRSICLTNPKNNKYLNGWLKRVDRMNYED